MVNAPGRESRQGLDVAYLSALTTVAKLAEEEMRIKNHFTSQTMSLKVCKPVSLSSLVCLSVHACVRLSLRLSVCLSVCGPVFLTFTFRHLLLMHLILCVNGLVFLASRLLSGWLTGCLCPCVFVECSHLLLPA